MVMADTEEFMHRFIVPQLFRFTVDMADTVADSTADIVTVAVGKQSVIRRNGWADPMIQ